MGDLLFFVLDTNFLLFFSLLFVISYKESMGTLFTLTFLPFPIMSFLAVPPFPTLYVVDHKDKLLEDLMTP